MSFLSSFKEKVENDSHLIPISVIILCGFLPFLWTRVDSLISWLDFTYLPNPLLTFKRALFLWDTSSALGSLNSRIPPTIFYELLRIFLDRMGFPLATAEKVFLSFIFIASGLSMYYLVSIIAKNKSRLAPLLAALFYMFNPYTMIFLWSNFTFSCFSYAFIPLRLGMFINALERKSSLRYIIYFALVWFVTTTPAYVNPVFALIDWLLLGFYFIYHLLVTRDKRTIKHTVKLTGILISIWLLLNIFWVLPISVFAKEEIDIAGLAVIGQQEFEIWRLNSASVVKVFRMAGHWGLESSYKGDPFYTWGEIFASPLFSVFGFLMTLLVFSCAILKRKNKYILYLFLLSVLSLFLIKGPHSPLGVVNTKLFSHPFLHSIYRLNYQKFGILLALSYAPLFGISLGRLCEIIKTKLGSLPSCFIIGVIAILVLVVYVYPLWTGEVIHRGGRVRPSSEYKVPSYYFEAKDWLSSDGTINNIFSLPVSKLGYANYRWEFGYSGPDLTPWILEKPVVIGTRGGWGISKVIARHFSSLCKSNALAKIFGYLNSKYLLFHQDTNWDYIEGHSWWISTSPEQYESILNNQRGIYLEKSFGKLDFYKISDEYFLPLIYPCP